jgi:hypothetical protein
MKPEVCALIDSLLGWPALGIIPLGKNIGCIMEVENVEGKKEPVKCGGECIYCGSDGGEFGLGHEHIVPYSLGGNTELLGASCRELRTFLFGGRALWTREPFPHLARMFAFYLAKNLDRAAEVRPPQLSH